MNTSDEYVQIATLDGMKNIILNATEPRGFWSHARVEFLDTSPKTFKVTLVRAAQRMTVEFATWSSAVCWAANARVAGFKTQTVTTDEGKVVCHVDLWKRNSFDELPALPVRREIKRKRR